MRKQTKRDLLELAHLIPDEQCDLLNELISLQTMLRKIKGCVRRNPRDTAGVNGYDRLRQQYGVLLRQVGDIIPDGASAKIREAVRAFEVEGRGYGVAGM